MSTDVQWPIYNVSWTTGPAVVSSGSLTEELEHELHPPQRREKGQKRHLRDDVVGVHPVVSNPDLGEGVAAEGVGVNKKPGAALAEPGLDTIVGAVVEGCQDTKKRDSGGRLPPVIRESPPPVVAGGRERQPYLWRLKEEELAGFWDVRVLTRGRGRGADERAHFFLWNVRVEVGRERGVGHMEGVERTQWV